MDFGPAQFGMLFVGSRHMPASTFRPPTKFLILQFADLTQFIGLQFRRTGVSKSYLLRLAFSVSNHILSQSVNGCSSPTQNTVPLIRNTQNLHSLQCGLPTIILSPRKGQGVDNLKNWSPSP